MYKSRIIILISVQKSGVNYQLLIVMLFMVALMFNLFLFSFDSYSQNVGVGINITGSLANPKSLLDIDAKGMSPKAGLLVPRMKTTERNDITSPTESLLIYNTDSHCFEAYYNGSWISWACLSNCLLPVPTAPTSGTNIPTINQITWNWNLVNGAKGYRWGTTNDYSSAIDNGISTTYTQTGLSSFTNYTLYVWAYNACGNSAATILTQTTSCAGGIETSGCGGLTTMTDSRDNNIYNIVQIGTQCWMQQNLNYGTLTTGAIQSSGQKWCYNGSLSNCTIYGGYYQWAIVMNGSAACNGCPDAPPCSSPVQGICPAGWHVPSYYEWVFLIQYICANLSSTGNCNTVFPYDYPHAEVGTGTTEGNSLKQSGLNYWNSPSAGTNSSGFTALGVGYYVSQYGVSNLKNLAGFWTSTESTPGVASDPELFTDSLIHWSADGEALGFSIRCLKN